MIIFYWQITHYRDCPILNLEGFFLKKKEKKANSVWFLPEDSSFPDR